MAVSAEKRSSRVRRQASKKQRKNRTVQVRFSDEELAALDAVCESTGMTRSAVLRSWPARWRPCARISGRTCSPR